MSLEMVQILYNPDRVMPENEHFYQLALKNIEEDGISSQVFVLLKQQGKLRQTPAFFQKQLKECYDKALFQNLFIKNQINNVLKNFEDIGIDVIPLKGVYFAEQFFNHIGARATSDIDLLIRNQDIEKAISLIHSLGFTQEEEQIPGHFHCSFSKRLPYSSIPLVVELHWSLVKENTSKFDIDDLWMEAKPVGESPYIMELSPNHMFYMICLHGWRHNLDSMKYFMDIIQVLYRFREKINYEEIIQLAKSHCTYKRIIRTISIVYHQFPQLTKVKVFPYQKKVHWEYRPGKGFKQYADFIDYQFFSFDRLRHSLIELKQWLWPSPYELSSQLEEDCIGFRGYSQLYKKRLSSIVNLFHH